MAITTITNAMVSVNAIQGTLIADNAITAVHIATNAVSGTLIADNAVTATHIAQNTITVTQLADDAVEADKIADGVITTNHLNSAMISSQSQVTPVAGDFVLIGDTSDSNNLKKVPISGITALATVAGISSSADATAITIDSSENVGIGNTSPDGKLHVQSATAGSVAADAEADELILESSSNTGLSMLMPGDGLCSILFGNPGTNGQKDGAIRYYGEIHSTTANRRNMVFTTGNSEAMRIDSSGNVGIGTTSPASPLHIRTSTNNNLEFEETSGDLRISALNDARDANVRLEFAASAFQFFTGAVTIDSSLSVGTNIVQSSTNAVHFMGGSTASFGNTAGIGIAGGDDFHANGSLAGDLVIAAAAGENIVLGTAASGGIYTRFRINTSGRQTYNDVGTANAHATFVGEVGQGFKALAFERTVGGGEVGTIVANTSSTTYNTSSDYRLKENINYSWDATTRLKQLKPARFNWIVDDTNTLLEGFLAHEVSSIVPEAVSGEKDAVDAENNPDYQGIDHSKLVPLLVKTVQELEARIKTLEG